MSEFENRLPIDGPEQPAGTIEMSREEKLARIQAQTRRHFLRSLTTSVGAMYLGGMMLPSFTRSARAADLAIDGMPRLDFRRDARTPLSILPPQFAARAKRVIYLHMAGAPSQLELFEHKPELARLDGQDCPASFLRASGLHSSVEFRNFSGRNFLSIRREKAGSGFLTGCRIWKSTLMNFALSSPCAPTSSTTRPRSCWCRPVMRAWAILRSDRGWSMGWALKIKIFPALSC